MVPIGTPSPLLPAVQGGNGLYGSRDFLLRTHRIGNVVYVAGMFSYR